MITVESFPSKSVGLYLPESLMFRSDSNGEDLEGYAGAGLYDSVPLHCPEPQRVDYSNDQIMTDLSFRNELLTKIARVGLELENLLESPQDIEGCVDEEGNVFVVQTRPQM
jgi:alpha-glucan,water dikinase